MRSPCVISYETDHDEPGELLYAIVSKWSLHSPCARCADRATVRDACRAGCRQDISPGTSHRFAASCCVRAGGIFAPSKIRNAAGPRFAARGVLRPALRSFRSLLLTPWVGELPGSRAPSELAPRVWISQSSSESGDYIVRTARKRVLPSATRS